MTLAWSPLDDGEVARSGALTVAVITPLAADPAVWAYSVTAVDVRGKGHGRVGSKAAARRAVERVWSAWLDGAGLASVVPEPAKEGGRNDAN